MAIELQTGKVLAFHDLEGLNEGDHPFTPRHITLLSIKGFKRGAYERFLDSVQIIAQDEQPFFAGRGGRAQYGPNNDIEADEILDIEGGLQRVHSYLLQAAWLNEVDAGVDPRYSGLNYSPHSTLKPNSRVEIPDVFMISDISVYFRPLGESAIRSITRFDLGGSANGVS